MFICKPKKISVKFWVLGLLLVGFSFIHPVSTSADTLNTSVTVGNSAPSFTAGPAESIASTTINPTNVGQNVTIQANASDSNGDNYYLAVCKTNAVTANPNAAPTCGGGSWCVSSSTSNGSQSTCSYQTQSGDAESNAWYAFVCDHSSGSTCSSASQGTGDTGSPFYVNHVPAFSAIATTPSTPAINPGSTVSWTATASDSDSTGTADTVKLLVCKTAGISGGGCDGGVSDQWCVSNSVASNPSCTYDPGSVEPDAIHNAYVYVFDSHNFAASSAQQGSNQSFTINNVTPVVSNVVINSDSAITLTPNTTTPVTITGEVTDNNSCSGGELASVTGSVYRSGVTFASCDTNPEDNNDSCYAVLNCTVTGGSCTGDTDATASYSCTADLYYYADPTDTSTVYAAQNWTGTIQATDDDAAADNFEATGVELNSLVTASVTSSVAYGNVSAGQKTDPLSPTTVVTGTGNVGLDEELSGADMCTDYPTCSANTIPVDNQRYGLTTLAFASATQLSASATEIELNVAKPSSGTTAPTGTTYWGINIPVGTIPGTYTGQNTLTVVKGETVDW